MLDVVIVRGKHGKIEKIYKVNEDGSYEVVSHSPWFIAERFMETKGVKDVEDVDYEFYAFNPSTWRYEKIADKCYRVITETPRDVRRIAETYEDHSIRHALSNIRYEARVSMDLADKLFSIKVPAPLFYGLQELEGVVRELYSNINKVKILGFDIEVKAEGSFPRPGSEVFLISICKSSLGSNEEEECWLLEKDEVSEFAKYLEKERPNYIVGFNSSGFDIPYLIAYTRDLRDVLKRSGYVNEPTIIPHIDILEILDQHAQSFGLPLGARLSLDDVAKRFGVATDEELKIESSIDRNRIWLEYQSNRSKILEYAETDAKLTARLGKVVLEVLLGLYALSGISPSVIPLLPSFGSVSEYAVLDILRRKYNKVLEVRWVRYTAKEIEDAVSFYKVHTKERFIKPLIAENIGYYDYSMLYPTIYYKYGLDPTGVKIGNGFKVYLTPKEDTKKKKKRKTFLKDCTSISVEFVPGPVYDVLKYFYEARKVSKKFKNEIKAFDQAVKILANSAYGMFSKARGGGVDEVLAAFIFYKSSHVLVNTIGVLRNLGYDVVYAATDSLFIPLPSPEEAEVLEDKLNRIIKVRFGDEFSIKLEKVCKYFALLKPKTYVCVSDDETLVKGMEKLEIPLVVKENLDEIFSRALRGEDYRNILVDIIRNAATNELFVKASNRLSELYSDEDRRFKIINNNRTKAVLLKYLIDEGQKINSYGNLVFDLYRDDLEDIPIVSYFLSSNRKYSGKKAIHVLVDYTNGKATTYECTLIESKSTRERLSGYFYCIRRELKREEIEKLAYSQSKTIIEYLSTIEKLRKQRTLGLGDVRA